MYDIYIQNICCNTYMGGLQIGFIYAYQIRMIINDLIYDKNKTPDMYILCG